MNDLARELGGALGIAVLGSVLQSTYRGNLDVTRTARIRLPSRPARRSHSAAQLGPSVKHEAQVAFADGMQVAFLCAAARGGGDRRRRGRSDAGCGRSLPSRAALRAGDVRRHESAGDRAGVHSPPCRHPRRGSGRSETPGRPIIRVEAGSSCPAPASLAPRPLESCAGSPRKLTLIRAPAGWGKSTLLADWHELESEARPFAWVALDGGDSDPVRFWTYLIHALRTLDPSAGEVSLPLLRAPRANVVDDVLPALFNELTALPQPVLLVLDDYHLVRSPEIDEGLASLPRAPSADRLAGPLEPFRAGAPAGPAARSRRAGRDRCPAAALLGGGRRPLPEQPARTRPRSRRRHPAATS